MYANEKYCNMYILYGKSERNDNNAEEHKYAIRYTNNNKRAPPANVVLG